MQSLSDLDDSKLREAEQALAYLDSISAFVWRPDNRSAIRELLGEAREALSGRQPEWLREQAS